MTAPPAAPPVPQYSGVNAAFLAQAHGAGLGSPDGDDDTIDLARGICSNFVTDPRWTVDDQIEVLRRAIGWPASTSRTFIATASAHYCPGQAR